jgi:hypothetical protein
MEDTMSNYDVVNFTNIDGEKFVGIYGGKEKEFAPHSVSMLPRFLATHYAKQLATKILMAQDKDWGNDSADRAQAEARILAEAEKQADVQEQAPQEAKEEEFAELKQGFTCDVCQREFKTEPALKAHKTREHSN